MSNYFSSFPTVPYLFGDEKSPVLMQKLSKYVDLIDIYSEDAAAYLEYEIRDGDRPDTLAYRLYEKSEYDFTFFLMNPRLRESGWPLTQSQLVEKAQNELFKNYTCKLDLSTADSVAEFADIYPVGTEVTVSGKDGVVVRKNLDVGEITISSDSDLTGGVTLAYKTPTTDPQTIGASLSNTVYEYEGTHHYENDSDEWLDKYFDNLSGAVLVTNLEFLESENDDTKRIKVLKKEPASQLVGELKRLLAQ